METIYLSSMTDNNNLLENSLLKRDILTIIVSKLVITLSHRGLLAKKVGRCTEIKRIHFVRQGMLADKIANDEIETGFLVTGRVDFLSFFASIMRFVTRFFISKKLHLF
ncbi:MAG TPA: hypothetical protein VEY68_10565 [Anoxybacillus sp.]|nr:hypothetical protein [Anoxybacillus sp.]